jgi:hypothetical protein
LSTIEHRLRIAGSTLTSGAIAASIFDGQRLQGSPEWKSFPNRTACTAGRIALARKAFFSAHDMARLE